MRTLTVTIEGIAMPGRTCKPADVPQPYENVHVGVQRRQEVVERIRGDAARASWTLEVTIKPHDGRFDLAGPFVHGRPGERFLYLSWGEVDGEDFTMFRRAKLMFADVPADVLDTAARSGRLNARVVMTDGRGDPRCARVRPPDIAWSAG